RARCAWPTAQALLRPMDRAAARPVNKVEIPARNAARSFWLYRRAEDGAKPDRLVRVAARRTASTSWARHQGRHRRHRRAADGDTRLRAGEGRCRGQGESESGNPERHNAGLAHDPEKCVAVFPRDKRAAFAAEIMRKQESR